MREGSIRRSEGRREGSDRRSEGRGEGALEGVREGGGIRRSERDMRRGEVYVC